MSGTCIEDGNDLRSWQQKATKLLHLALGFCALQSVYRPALTEHPMRKARDNSQALAAFVTGKDEFDALLARLTALSAEHFRA